MLGVLDGLDPNVWTRTDVVGERGLGAILVHHLGASQRWRHGFQDTGEFPEPEDEPLPTIGELRERWQAEWAVVDAWLPTVTDGFVGYVHNGTGCGGVGPRRLPSRPAGPQTGPHTGLGR